MTLLSHCSYYSLMDQRSQSSSLIDRGQYFISQLVPHFNGCNQSYQIVKQVNSSFYSSNPDHIMNSSKQLQCLIFFYQELQQIHLFMFLEMIYYCCLIIYYYHMLHCMYTHPVVSKINYRHIIFFKEYDLLQTIFFILFFIMS